MTKTDLRRRDVKMPGGQHESGRRRRSFCPPEITHTFEVEELKSLHGKILQMLEAGDSWFTYVLGFHEL